MLNEYTLQVGFEYSLTDWLSWFNFWRKIFFEERRKFLIGFRHCRRISRLV